MHSNFQNDFGSGSQYQENQSESTYPNYNHDESESTKHNTHSENIDGSASQHSSKYTTVGHHNSQNKNQQDKRYNSNQSGAGQNQKHNLNYEYGIDSITIGGGNRSKGNSNSYQNSGNQSYQEQQPQQDKQKNNNQNNNQQHPRQDHYSNQKSSDGGGGKRHHQNNHIQNQQQPYRSGPGSMHHGHDKKGQKGAHGPAHQSDQHLSTGSPTNSFNDAEGAVNRNTRQPDSQQNSNQEKSSVGGYANDRGNGYNHGNHHTNKSDNLLNQHHGIDESNDFQMSGDYNSKSHQKTQRISEIRQNQDDKSDSLGIALPSKNLNQNNNRQEFDLRSSGGMQISGSGGQGSGGQYFRNDHNQMHQNNNGQVFLQQRIGHGNNYPTKSNMHGSKQSIDFSSQLPGSSTQSTNYGSTNPQQPLYSGSQGSHQSTHPSHRNQNFGQLDMSSQINQGPAGNSGSQGKHGGKGGTMSGHNMHQLGNNSQGGGPPNSSGGGKKGGSFNRYNTDLDNFYHQSDKKHSGNSYVSGSQIQQYQQQVSQQNQSTNPQQNLPQKNKKNKHGNNNNNVQQQFHQDSNDDFQNDLISNNNFTPGGGTYQGSAHPNNDGSHLQSKPFKQNSFGMNNNRNSYKQQSEPFQKFQSESMLNQTTRIQGTSIMSSGPIPDGMSRNEHGFQNYSGANGTDQRGSNGTTGHDFSVKLPPPPPPPPPLPNQPLSIYQDTATTRDSENNQILRKYLPDVVKQENNSQQQTHLNQGSSSTGGANKNGGKNISNNQGRGSSKNNNLQQMGQNLQPSSSTIQSTSQKNMNNQPSIVGGEGPPGLFEVPSQSNNQAFITGKDMQSFQNIGGSLALSNHHIPQMYALNSQNQQEHQEGENNRFSAKNGPGGLAGVARLGQQSQEDNAMMNQTPNLYPGGLMASTSPDGYNPNQGDYPQAKQLQIQQPPMPQFGQGNNVFLQQNFNQQVYITDNHFYQQPLIPGATSSIDLTKPQMTQSSGHQSDFSHQQLAGTGHIASIGGAGIQHPHNQGATVGPKDMNGIISGVGIPKPIDVVGSQQQILPASSMNNCFQTIDGNWEHMEEARVKDVLVEIEVKLINGDMEKIRITEAKDAKLPLNFFDIQLQIKERLRQLKSMLLVPTLTQKKQAAEKTQPKNEVADSTPSKLAEKSKKDHIENSEKKKQVSKQTSPQIQSVSNIKTAGVMSRDDFLKDESGFQQSTKEVFVKKIPNQMTAEEKEQEKLYQDLIEALEFFVKRQLQHNLMPKYKLIAQNTHKIQFQQSIKKLQNDQFFYQINNNSHQIPGVTHGAALPGHGLTVAPGHSSGGLNLINQLSHLNLDQQLLQVGQPLGSGTGQPPLLQGQSPYSQSQHMNSQVSRVYTPVEVSYGIANQSQQNLTPTHTNENHLDGQPARLFDQLNLGQPHISTPSGYTSHQGRPPVPPYGTNLPPTNLFYGGPQDPNQQFGTSQIDQGQISNFLMGTGTTIPGGASQQSQLQLRQPTLPQQKISPSMISELNRTGTIQLGPQPPPPSLQLQHLKQVPCGSGLNNPGVPGHSQTGHFQFTHSYPSLQSKEFHPKKAGTTQSSNQKVGSPEGKELAIQVTNSAPISNNSKKPRVEYDKYQGKAAH